MPPTVDARQLIAILRDTPPDHNVLLVGGHGVGKSQIVRDHFAESDGPDVVPFFLGQMADPGDLLGLMNKDVASGRSVFLPPYWWPADDRPVVLFLDELNRARPELLQTVMELALDQRLAGRRLPVGSRLVAAVNDGDQYQVTDLDPALVSRFNVYRFQPTADDWFDWATRHNLDQRLIDFLRSEPHRLDPPAGGGGSGGAASDDGRILKHPDRRAWARVSDLLPPDEGIDEHRFRLIAGVVGQTAASALRRHLASADPNASTIASSARRRSPFDGDPSDATLDDLSDRNLAIAKTLGAAEAPPDGFVEATFRYVRRLEDGGRPEAAAHLATLLSDDSSPLADRVAASSDLTAWLIDRLRTLRV